jgi:hypothetical protein
MLFISSFLDSIQSIRYIFRRYRRFIFLLIQGFLVSTSGDQPLSADGNGNRNHCHIRFSASCETTSSSDLQELWHSAWSTHGGWRSTASR